MHNVHFRFPMLAVGLALASVGHSQPAGGDRLLNVDSGSPVAMGKFRFDIGFAFHRGAEGRTYTSGTFGYGVSEGWELGVRASGAPRGDSTSGGVTIRTGGRDFEVFAKHSLKSVEGLTLSLGASFPDTPAQDQNFITAGASYTVPQGDAKHRFVVGARGAMRKDSNLWGVSAGVVAPFQSGWEAVADVTAIVQGNNSLTSDGDRARRAIFGFGVRYRPVTAEGAPSTTFTLGLSNGLGATTGFGLSSALEGKMALTLGVSVRN